MRELEPNKEKRLVCLRETLDWGDRHIHIAVSSLILFYVTQPELVTTRAKAFCV